MVEKSFFHLLNICIVNARVMFTSIAGNKNVSSLDIAFLDFSKALRRYAHHTLLNKLAENFNIRGQTWYWLKAFLTGRFQRVLYRGALYVVHVSCYI